ncbi:MAG: hypothetical protein K2X93_23435 [Candidatus Obscuribacterales bacterium]|nr:hypothetical protein [Candidatus Obscuribacterales bacterium]
MKLKKTFYQSRPRNKRRASHGAVLAEGVVGTIIFILISVPLLIFLGNMSAHLLYVGQLSAVASNLAWVACKKDGDWLGLPRPNTYKNPRNQDYSALAQQMCSKLGIKNASARVSVDQSFGDATIYTCDLNANVFVPFPITFFGFNFAQLFPGSVSARGVSAVPLIQPYAMVKIDGPIIDNPATKTGNVNKRLICYLPAYGFSREGETTQEPPLGTPYHDRRPDNCVSLNHWPLDKEMLDYMGVQYLPNRAPVGKQCWPTFVHPQVFGDNTNDLR